MNFTTSKCQYEDCGLILENPVTLLCGNNLCLKHLEGLETKFKCFFCPKQHTVPEDGFCVNKTIEQMIENFYQSDPLRKKIKEAFDSLNETFKDYKCIDPDVYIYDYFAEIRNKVDLHKEELIKEIIERSEKIIKELTEKEQKCKSDAAKIVKIDLDLDKLELFKQVTRRADLNLGELNKLLDEINQKKEETQEQIKEIRNELLLGETIEFKKIENSSLFGELITKKNNISLSKDCGKLVRIFDQHTKLVREFEVDEYSNKLITASVDNTIKIWDFESGNCLKTLVDHDNWVTSILLIPNNKLVSGSVDKTIKIWDLDSYECLNTLTNESHIYSLCLISDNQIASGGGNGSISIWNLDNLTRVKTFKAHENCLSYMLLFDKTKLITCSSDKKIKIFNLETFKCIRVLEGHTNSISYLELTKDSKLLSSSIDKTVKLWQIETGEELKSIEFDFYVYCVKTLNEDLIAVALGKGKIQIFNLSKMKQIKTIKAHSSTVFRLIYLSSNGNLLSSSNKGDVKLQKIFD
jgi:hypothetical protein